MHKNDLEPKSLNLVKSTKHNISLYQKNEREKYHI